MRSLSLAGPSAQPAEDSGVLKHAVLVEEEEGGGGGLRAVHIRGITSTGVISLSVRMTEAEVVVLSSCLLNFRRMVAF